MKIATWNVNSIKVRLPRLLEWLEEAQPDVLALQELKCTEENFPFAQIEAAGYRAAVHGQKTYNGVALLSRHPMSDIRRGLPGNEDDDQSRYIEATVRGVRVCGLYLPNGNPVDSEKFTYKLRWMEHLRDHARAMLKAEIPFLLAGDFNVCPSDADVYDPAVFAEDALCHPQSRHLYRQIVYLGLTDAYRALHPHEHAYSFWDYQRGAWARDHGLRIDHLLLSPWLADRLEAADIDKAPRGRERPSDHTPVWCTLADKEKQT